MSCIESEEEIWINPDGSSLTQLRLKLPAAAQRKAQAEFTAINKVAGEIEGVHLRGPEFSSTSDGTTELFCELQVDSASAGWKLYERMLRETASSNETKRSPAAAMLGQVDLGFENFAARFKRHIFTSELLPLTNSTEKASKRNQRLLGDASLRYIIHLPSPPLQSNAHQKLDQGRTQIWSFKLYDHLDQNAQIDILWRPLIPWWMWTLVCLVSLLVIALLGLALRRFSRK